MQRGLLPQATCKKSVIINDVDDQISVTTNEHILAFIIGGLISNAVQTTSNNCIRVDAASAQDGIRLRVKNNGAFIYSHSMYSLVTLTDAARKLGGTISLETETNGAFTVIFSLGTAV